MYLCSCLFSFSFSKYKPSTSCIFKMNFWLQTRLFCAEKLRESAHSSVQNLCGCIYNFLGSIVHMIQLISYPEHIINHRGEDSLPFSFVVTAAAAWSSRRIWEQLQPQEHSTFAHLVSQFCLLHRHKLLPWRVQGKMRALLHPSCPVKGYTFNIRIKILTDLLPCGGKHQNSTMPGGNNRELRFQAAFSATNAQLKYSWAYKKGIVLLGYRTCLWSFLNTCIGQTLPVTLWPGQNYSFPLEPAVSNYFWTFHLPEEMPQFLSYIC